MFISKILLNKQIAGDLNMKERLCVRVIYISASH